MKKKLLLVLIPFISIHAIQEKKIKLYAFYTPSHQIFKDNWFLKTLQDDYDVIMKFYPQECKNATFGSKGWRETTLHKIELMIEAVTQNWNEIFIYSDVDIQFFRPTQTIILNLIKDKDILIQKNGPSGELCSGFFACRGNAKTLALWKNVKQLMIENNLMDQQALNILLFNGNKHNVQWDYLPNQFFGGGTLTEKIWHPRMHLPIPKDIILHHANYTIGIRNKIAQLNYVRNKVNLK